MKLIIYFIIFGCKVIENSLSTLRLIVVANGKKWLGASLLFITSLIWVFTTGIVIVDIQKDPLRIFFFCFGSFIGSLIGNIIENKIALGNNVVFCIINQNEKSMIDTLRELGFAITTLPAYGKDSKKYVLMIFTTRKKRKELVTQIENLSDNAMILSESALQLRGGYLSK